MMDDYTGKSRWFGFVEMANAEDGEKAIMPSTALCCERALNVNQARPKKEPGSSGGRDSRNRSGVEGAGSHRSDSVIRLSLTRSVSSCPPIPG